MKRFGMILMACFFLSGCGQEAPVVAPEPETTVVEEQAPVAEETKEEVLTEVEEVDEPEEVVLDVIPEEYAYSLTVSINPEVKLYFDASDVIVGVEYKNEDAIDAYADLELVGASSKDGLNQLIDAAVEKDYLKDDGQVSIELTEVVDETAITDNTPLIQAQEIIAEHIEEITVAAEEAEDEDAEAAAPALQIQIQVDVAEDVTEKTGIKPVVVCPDCNGTGNDCKECNGTAIVNCKRCSGGWETCGICNGSGHEICHGCKGTGVDDMGGTCNRCNGAGHSNSCVGCGGAGGFNCSWCKGALKHICPECWGEQICGTCKGAGTI